jgi:TonB family protein
MQADYYVWQVDGKPVRVELSLTVIDRLQALIAHAVDLMPDHEMGGILVGRLERRRLKRVVSIEDFEPIDMEDRPALRRRLRELGENVVGMFRSHARDGLRLDQRDAAIVERHFTNAGMVYLLVKPQPGEPSVATFFIQEHGAMVGYSGYLEFPFHSGRLRAGNFPVIGRSIHRDSGRQMARWASIVTGMLVALALTPLLVRWVPQVAHAEEAPVVASPQAARSAASVAPPVSKPSPVKPPAAHTAAPPHPTRVATVWIQAAGPGRMRGMWSHLRHLARRRNARFVPVRALHEVAPPVPADSNASDQPVVVKVWIDRHGRVTNTEVLSSNSPELTQIAANAAGRWRFAPARLNRRAIDSQAVLHFRF